MVVLPAWVGGFDGGAVGVGVGLMVEPPAWVRLGLYFGGFVVPAWVWLRLWGKKKKKNNNCFYNILIEYTVE